MHSKNDGVSNYGTITTLAESPAQPGVIWAGTDDGNLQVSRDGGTTWTNVVDKVPGVPARTWVSRVEPSHAEPGTCYVSFDGHRSGDTKPHVFVTRDFGASWRSVAANLPDGNVNVIKEDPKNPSLLYLGTEFAFYVSLDGGAEWKRFMTGLPTVRIDDVIVHPRENDLIIGTHGRSILIVDDITPLQQFAAARRQTTTSDAGASGAGRGPNANGTEESGQAGGTDAILFDIRPATLWRDDVALARSVGGARHFRGENPDEGTFIHYYLRSSASGVKITISDVTGKVVRTLAGTGEAGINRVRWNLRTDPPPRQPGEEAGRGGRGGRGGQQQGPPVEPGQYLVKVSIGGRELAKTVTVEADTWMRQ
jgi:hypothetical protein